MSIKTKIAKKLRPFVEKYNPVPPITPKIIERDVPYVKLQAQVEFNPDALIGVNMRDVADFKRGMPVFRQYVYDRAKRQLLDAIRDRMLDDGFIEYKLRNDGCGMSARAICIRPDDLARHKRLFSFTDEL